MSAKRYFKFDESDQYLENEADINYFVVNQARRVAFGNMLGDFDENGIYVIDEEIVKELIMMPKVVVDSVEGADLIRGAIRFDGYVHFMLNIEDDMARLILLEKVNFESNVKYNVGRYSNMNEYVLGEIKIPDRDIDKNIIYAKFNILREDSGKYYDFRDLTQKELEMYNGLIGKMKRNLVVQDEMYNNEKAIEIAEADYFDNILSAFSKHGKIKIEFENFLKTIILEKQKFIQINKPFFQKTMNEILDGAVLMFLSKLSPEVREEIEEEIRKAKEKYFYDFSKLIHIQFVTNANLMTEPSDKMINEIMVNKHKPVKISRFEIDEKKTEKSFEKVLEENNKIKSQVLDKNANKKDITADNPVLTKFFGEIKKETGNDLLKPKEDSVELIKKIAPSVNVAKVADKTTAPASTRPAGNKTTENKRPSTLISRSATPAPSKSPAPQKVEPQKVVTNKAPQTAAPVTKNARQTTNTPLNKGTISATTVVATQRRTPSHYVRPLVSSTHNAGVAQNKNEQQTKSALTIDDQFDINY